MIYKCDKQAHSFINKMMNQTINMTKHKKLIIILIVSTIGKVELSQEVMKNISINFAKPMEVCMKELELPDSVAKDFANFWREGYQLADRSTGCAIMCISEKLDLLDQEYELHHGNAMDFAKKHGAVNKLNDDEIIKRQMKQLTVRHSRKKQIKSMGWGIALILTVVNVCWGEMPEQLIMERFSSNIGVEVMKCKETLYFEETIIDNLWAYWNTDLPLIDPEMGCVLKCVLENLGLLELENKVPHPDNIAAFFQANGSDDLTTEAIITLAHVCLKATKAQEPCLAALDLALCFRTGVDMMGWAPDITPPDYSY